MQYILQEFEDTNDLSDILTKLGIEHSLHKVVPFVGELQPEPVINSSNVVFFGSYSLRHYAKKHGIFPGVFTINPYIYEQVWKDFCLNKDAIISPVNQIMGLKLDGSYFIRPVDDSKSISGQIMDETDIEALVKGVMNLKPDEYIVGGLTPETQLMLTKPSKIVTEWRTWVIDGKVVTYSRYKVGSRVVYSNEIDDDALEFAKTLAWLNPTYSPAYCLDICRTDDDQLHLLETNCMNAAGFYAADKYKIVEALETLYG